jgi:uncharacterized cupredoxin-like copper-binding protein
MRLRPIAVGLAVAGVISFGAVATGCGSDDETSSTAAADSGAATTTPAAGGETLTIEMGEFYYKPGTVTIDAPNAGSAPHELVLAKTNDDPAQLPTGSDGSVDEEALDVPGEISEVAGGADGTVTLDLDAGKYVIFCNLPGHYSSGMYGSLTVK